MMALALYCKCYRTRIRKGMQALLQATGHTSYVADHVTQTRAREKKSWQSEHSHASKDDYYTHCMRKEKRPEGRVHKKGK